MPRCRTEQERSDKLEEKQFIAEVAEIIEANPALLTMDSDFRSAADYWSSLTGFGILVFMQDRFNIEIDVDDFLKLNTIGELYSLILK